MNDGSGISRGDRNYNPRLERLHGLVPVTNAIFGIDLAGTKQMVVVTDHDSKSLRGRLSGAGPGSRSGAGLGCRARCGERRRRTPVGRH
jgi:hypothetical protein